MKISWSFTLISTTVFLALLGVLSAEPDFKAAMSLIEPQKSRLDYSKLCDGKPSQGRVKLGCRLKKVPSVGLLVCRKPDECEFNIRLELISIKEVADAGIRIVKAQTLDEIISGLKCGVTKDATCFGYLEEWIPSDKGWFEHLINRFQPVKVDKELPILLKNIKEKQKKASAWKKTVQDLEAIVKFMKPGPGECESSASYKQICDLQGFFLFDGGFVVVDPEGVIRNISLGDYCATKGDPTTKNVLDNLTTIIDTIKSWK